MPEQREAAFWQPDILRTPIEYLVEYLLTGALPSNAPEGMKDLAEKVLRFDVRDTRVVVLGGGTGLSTIVGGNSQMPDWPDQPDVGIKQDFPNLISVVVTTDDGGSTGQLLKTLPMIGVGDLRKLLLSSIQPDRLQRKYGLDYHETRRMIRMIHGVFNFRFRNEESGFKLVKNPSLAVPSDLRCRCPKQLSDAFRRLGAYIAPGGAGPTIFPAAHSLGNLLLTAAIFEAAHGRTDRAPGVREIQHGIDHIADLIGAPAGRIHAATATPGQLKFRYANGVVVYGQSKSAWARRDSPVESVAAEFARRPLVSPSVRKAIALADLIIYAPGSLYTSMIPILQLDPIAASIRSNRRAMKILGANSWIQEGETDISLKNEGRGFLVSELIEAYDRNILHGIKGLFDVVLSANLEKIPGSILRNYALERKSPIHMDRSRVEAMGFHAIEATLLAPEHQRKTKFIHHDARRFALAIRALLFADKFLKNKNGYTLRRPASRGLSSAADSKGHGRRPSGKNRIPLLCDHFHFVRKALSSKIFRPGVLGDSLLEIAWENRDIPPSHFGFFRGGAVVPAGKWDRSTEWDNILGYFDPRDGYIKLHQDLLSDPSRFGENLLIALGESLLGRYIEHCRWIEQQGARFYEITLRAVSERQCFLTNAQLLTYLKLARMTPDPVDTRIHRIAVNSDGGFLPPGLLFGLLYAWYLTGRGITMKYEMNLLRWPLKSLTPLHARDRNRKEALVDFFRAEVFGHR